MFQSSIKLVVGFAQVMIKPSNEAMYFQCRRSFLHGQQVPEAKSSRELTILAVTMFRKSGGSALRGVILIGQKWEVTEIYVASHFVSSHDDGDFGWIGRLLLRQFEDSWASRRCPVCVRWRVGLVA